MEYNQNPNSNYNVNPGGNMGPQGMPPDNNLVWAIICTVLCCLPLGIVAIVKSTQVNSKWQMGDVIGAQQASKDAKKFSIIGIAIGGVFVIIYILLMVFGIVASQY